MTPRVDVIDESPGGWVRLVLNEPRGNLLSLGMVRAADRALDEVSERLPLRWVTVEGAGREFSFGAKIDEHLPAPMREVLPETHALLRRWLALPVPTAALVDGRCLGGGFELALACDDILATPESMFGLPEVKLGAMPPAGALLLPLRAGGSRAARAVITGDVRDAGYWHDAGLLSLTVPGTPLLDAARDWFETRLAPRSAVVLGEVALAARAVVRSMVEPLLADLERRYLDRLLATEDAAEGIRAWMERREPRWKDK
jgi:cyclohexa-1,5-dienecarbonyl-CoA hydratase